MHPESWREGQKLSRPLSLQCPLKLMSAALKASQRRTKACLLILLMRGLDLSYPWLKPTRNNHTKGSWNRCHILLIKMCCLWFMFWWVFFWRDLSSEASAGVRGRVKWQVECQKGIVDWETEGVEVRKNRQPMLFCITYPQFKGVHNPMSLWGVRHVGEVREMEWWDMTYSMTMQKEAHNITHTRTFAHAHVHTRARIRTDCDFIR